MLDFNSEELRSSYFPSNKCEDSSPEISHNSRFLSNNTQPNYSHHMQFLSSQHFSARPSQSTNLLSHSLSSTSKSSMDLSSIKNVSIPAGSSRVNNNNLYLSLNTSTTTLSMPSTLSTAYLPHQNIPETSYSQLSKHLIWNTNLFYTQKSCSNDGLLSYPGTFENILNQKLCDKSYIKNKNDPSFSSNCSDVNSDDSIDVSDRDKEIQISENPKKRNPYSIEELLKKPEKRIRRTIQMPPNESTNNFIHRGAEISEGNISNQISIEVCD